MIKKEKSKKFVFTELEFGFIFKPYSLESQVDSVKTISRISDFYSRLNKGQIVIEDVITDDIHDHIIEFGPFDFINYPTEELENTLKVKKELTLEIKTIPADIYFSDKLCLFL